MCIAVNPNVVKVVIGELRLLGLVRNACVGGGRGGERDCPSWRVLWAMGGEVPASRGQGADHS